MTPDAMKPLPPALVVSLRDDLARREHVVRHFHACGIEQFGFWPAVAHTDALVKQAYRDGLVAGFPACFRCGRERCDCANNVLVPQQVANWLSFLSLWRTLPDDPARLFLVCEDDVAFHHHGAEALRAFLDDFVPSRRHVLIRLASSGEEPFREVAATVPAVSQRVVMSNAAYVLNGSMAHWLLRRFERIATTSDIWLHRQCAGSPEVQALTLEPLLATDLSFNKSHARFVSRIHPKGIDADDEQRARAHRKRAEDAADYAALRASWGV